MAIGRWTRAVLSAGAMVCAGCQTTGGPPLNVEYQLTGGAATAFAMDVDGGNWGRAWGQPSPRRAAERALDDCNLLAGRGCQVYALGNDVLADATPDGLAAAQKAYARAVLSDAAEAGRMAARWQGRVSADGIEPGTAVNPAPFAKAVAIRIGAGRFDLVPDASYSGAGVVDRQGNATVRWKPQDLSPYLGTRNPRIFRFDGWFDRSTAVLDGERGPRRCRIELARP